MLLGGLLMLLSTEIVALLELSAYKSKMNPRMSCLETDIVTLLGFLISWYDGGNC